MKRWRGLFLLLILQGPQVLRSQSEGLYCYVCFSTTSWEDCNKNAQQLTCPEGDDDVCVEMQVDKWEMVPMSHNIQNTVLMQPIVQTKSARHWIHMHFQLLQQIHV
ncbi:hypothetical protein OS493_003285 [Desmophyllum pertusum]|uniref:Uncharacterized protein n=1 Tax=Desmophyllum pertusum TaxID=174260 RepID=A0A9W9YGZ0_9CNID|nr:hypothetical protein OS493_003285 [Desmophyllum pertusum]